MLFIKEDWTMSSKTPGLRAVALLLCLMILLPACVFAQFESGTILGTVKDATGAAIPNANVTLTNVGTSVKQQAKTDGNGNYEFVNQRPGTYTVQADMQGFQPAGSNNFSLAVNARQR